MDCPKCNHVMKLELKLTGGCNGHNGPEDRCYCDSADVHVEYSCINNIEHLWEGKWWRKNPSYCKQLPLLVGELSCNDSIERWLRENYTPGPNANIYAQTTRRYY